MDIDALFAELEARVAADQRISKDDLSRWTRELGVSRDVLFDAIAAVLAYGFHRGTRTFEFCDTVVSRLFAADPDGNNQRGLFWKVFLAFDDGEYHHRDRPLDEDPVEVYTRPQIAEIVSDLEGKHER